MDRFSGSYACSTGEVGNMTFFEMTSLVGLRRSEIVLKRLPVAFPSGAVLAPLAISVSVAFARVLRLLGRAHRASAHRYVREWTSLYLRVDISRRRGSVLTAPTDETRTVRRQWWR